MYHHSLNGTKNLNDWKIYIIWWSLSIIWSEIPKIKNSRKSFFYLKETTRLTISGESFYTTWRGYTQYATVNTLVLSFTSTNGTNDIVCTSRVTGCGADEYSCGSDRYYNNMHIVLCIVLLLWYYVYTYELCNRRQ